MTPAELFSWRSKAGLSQSGLARLLGVHRLTISKWERGDREIPPYLHWALKGITLTGQPLYQRAAQ